MFTRTKRPITLQKIHANIGTATTNVVELPAPTNGRRRSSHSHPMLGLGRRGVPGRPQDSGRDDDGNGKEQRETSGC